MATVKDLIIDGTHAVAGNLSAEQHKFVKLDTDGTVIAIAAITDIPFGVLQNKPDAAGKGADVARFGSQVKVEANTTLAIPDVVGTSADGQADPIVAGSDTTVYVVGVVAEGADDGELATISLNCLNPNRAA